MTGPEHYAEAERLLQPLPGHPEPYPPEVARAQAHAILGLTAAIVADSIMRRADRHEWDRATGYDPDSEVTA
jgi:hypothetical protein